jgi:predicted component of type VI protein secretion system
MNKYGNRKTEIDGIVFDSKHEALRYCELKYMERARMIKNLRRQVPYVLIPTQRDGKGRVIEREVKYIADFVYWQHINGDEWIMVVEDAKGMRTDVYKLKKKLMLERYGIRIQEV